MTIERLLVGGQNTKRWLESVDADYLICGHTHLPGEMTYQGKHYYNSGSVGIAIGDSGLLDKAPWFVSSNIQTLLTGIDYSSQLVEMAAQLSREAGEHGQADEKYWAEAAKCLGVPDYRKILPISNDS